MSIISWLFPAILVELAILMFMWFRRIRRYRIFLVIPGLFGPFLLLMAILVAARYASEGPMRFDTDDSLLLIVGFVVLAVLIALVPRIRWRYANNMFGDAARRRDELDPPRKRPFWLDALGCLVIGAALLVGLVLLIAALLAYAQ